MQSAAPLVYVSGREVVASGALVVAPREAVEIAPAPGSRLPLRIAVSFEQEAGNAPRMDANAEGNVVTLRLFNFFDPNGICIGPIAIGIAEGRVLQLSCFVQVLGSRSAATRLFNYTISLAPAV